MSVGDRLIDLVPQELRLPFSARLRGVPREDLARQIVTEMLGFYQHVDMRRTCHKLLAYLDDGNLALMEDACESPPETS